MSPIEANIEPLAQSELADAFALQKMAFVTEAMLYQNFHLPPLDERFEQFVLEFQQKTFLKAVLDSRLVGVVRGFIKDDTGHIERLAVHPGYQRRGIGAALIGVLERELKASRYELFTGSLSVSNLRLYEKLCYCRFQEKQLKPNIQLVLLEKTVNWRAARGEELL